MGQEQGMRGGGRDEEKEKGRWATYSHEFRMNHAAFA